MNIGPTEALIAILVIVVLFGSTRLPGLAHALGEASAELRAARHKSRPAPGAVVADDSEARR